MSKRRGFLSWVILAALVLLPTLVLAEVSVQVDSRGKYKRYWYLTARSGRTEIVWRQVRSNLPHHLQLNPLGDNLGDRPPVIQVLPSTGYPWVVWPKNFGNIRQLAFSTWDGSKWTEPSLVHPGVPLVYDDADPAFAIDQAGAMYLVWSRGEQTSKIYFSTFINGRWTPALLVSDAAIHSQAPSITLHGKSATIRFKTPTGPVINTYDSGALIQTAAGLMDNPLPPLSLPPVAPPTSDGPVGVKDSRHRR